MDISKNVKETLKWDKEGSGTLEIELENNVITRVMLCENGNDLSTCYTSIQKQHLRNIAEVLTELFVHMDKQVGSISEEEFKEETK